MPNQPPFPILTVRTKTRNSPISPEIQLPVAIDGLATKATLRLQFLGAESSRGMETAHYKILGMEIDR